MGVERECCVPFGCSVETREGNSLLHLTTLIDNNTGEELFKTQDLRKWLITNHLYHALMYL